MEEPVPTDSRAGDESGAPTPHRPSHTADLHLHSVEQEIVVDVRVFALQPGEDIAAMLPRQELRKRAEYGLGKPVSGLLTDTALFPLFLRLRVLCPLRL